MQVRRELHFFHDLQIQAGGHMGWFHGVAFIPSLAPAGFSTSNLSPEP